MPGNQKRLLIEGWRSIPHSYSLVNQFQILELLSRPQIRIAHRELPIYRAEWQKRTGLFSAEQEERVAALPAPAEGETFDAAYRISYPYNLAASPAAPRTLVFGTAEMWNVPKRFMGGKITLAEAHRNSSAIIVTPSNWSRKGFLQAGAAEERLVVIPHGVDPTVFAPMEAGERDKVRRARKLDGFMFLTVGAVTMNKGIDLLLKALAVVTKRHPEVFLAIKGLDNIFQSDQMFAQELAKLTPQEAAQVRPRLRYFGGVSSLAGMAKMYQVADAYVAPYRAEGFGLPILEAVACGLPVICTAGGSSDDFVRDDFALRISSQIADTTHFNEPAKELRPNLEHLIELMMTVIEKPEISQGARAAGPKFVQGNFTWRHAMDKLVDVLFPKGAN